jgi:FixJ family two-component response regulator
MTEANQVVFVVDDDASVRDAIGNLLESVGLCAQMFSSTEEFMQAQRPEVPACLVLDIRLPGKNGLEFQEELKKASIEIPIIFITAHGDIPMTKRAMKAGAIEFLTKPFEKQDLLNAIEHGVARNRLQRQERAEFSVIQARLNELTSREREVMDLVVSGLINKQIATHLGLSEITVKIHRGRVMQKMQVASLADLVRVAEKLKVLSPQISISPPHR